MPATLVASITHSIIGLPQMVCSGLGVLECIRLPFPALNIIEQISIKVLYLLKLKIKRSKLYFNKCFNLDLGS